MKKIKSLLILSTLFLFISISVQAAEVKIGIIDTQKILAQSKRIMEVSADSYKTIEDKRNELLEKQKTLQALEEELKTKGQEMPIQERREKSELYSKGAKEFQRLKEDIEFEAKLISEELTRKFSRELAEIIKEYQITENYTIILEASNIRAYDASIDITDQIIQIYDSGK